MSHAPPPRAALPSWWDERTFAFADISYFIATPFDTVRGYHRLAIAQGFPIGEQTGRYWSFSARDMFAFALMAAMTKLPTPVGIAQVKACVHFSQADHRPDYPLQMISPDETARIVVDAPVILERVAAHCAGDRHA